MPYYNPERWIAKDDRLVSDVEGRVILRKRARSTDTSVRGGIRPPLCLEFEVVIIDTGEVLRMVEWVDREGKVFVNLEMVDFPFRKGHYNQPNYHHNPDGRNIRPPHHVHFPTVKCQNLNEPHSYAYPANGGSNYLEVIKEFCQCNNIEIVSLKLPFRMN
ncbi:hypothetical protein ES705_18596 [subsurface metagenome]